MEWRERERKGGIRGREKEEGGGGGVERVRGDQQTIDEQEHKEKVEYKKETRD